MSAHGHHRHGDDFDWEALADSLELEAAITMPIVDDVVASSLPADVTSVVDVGCGPGAVAVHLAHALPGARVMALDSSAALLERVRRRAADAGLGDRVVTIVGDLDHPLPHLSAPGHRDGGRTHRP